MKAKRIMLLAAVLFFGVFTLSAQTKDEVKAEKAKASEEKKAAAEEAAKNAPKTEQQLLAEIVELLKDQQK